MHLWTLCQSICAGVNHSNCPIPILWLSSSWTRFELRKVRTILNCYTNHKQWITYHFAIGMSWSRIEPVVSGSQGNGFNTTPQLAWTFCLYMYINATIMKTYWKLPYRLKSSPRYNKLWLLWTLNMHINMTMSHRCNFVFLYYMMHVSSLQLCLPLLYDACVITAILSSFIIRCMCHRCNFVFLYYMMHVSSLQFCLPLLYDACVIVAILSSFIIRCMCHHCNFVFLYYMMHVSSLQFCLPLLYDACVITAILSSFIIWCMCHHCNFVFLYYTMHVSSLQFCLPLLYDACVITAILSSFIIRCMCHHCNFVFLYYTMHVSSLQLCDGWCI